MKGKRIFLTAITLAAATSLMGCEDRPVNMPTQVERTDKATTSTLKTANTNHTTTHSGGWWFFGGNRTTTTSPNSSQGITSGQSSSSHSSSKPSVSSSRGGFGSSGHSAVS